MELSREVFSHQPYVPSTMHQTEHAHLPILREVVQHNHSAPTMTMALLKNCL